MKWYAISALFYVFAGSLFYWGYIHKKQFNYPAKTFFGTYGLDVSHHQGEINWKLVGKTKFKFVYIKATEGESFKDKNFLQNYARAKKQNIKVGGYHFWTFCKTAKEQIDNLFNTIPHSKGDLVPAIDIESTYSCGMEKDHGRVIMDLEEINVSILKNYGVLPVIYTTREFIKVHFEILKTPNIFWLRSMVGPPLYKKKWGLWQYYNGATVKGIYTPVDVNVLNPKLSMERITQK